jgi:peptide deformylase
MEQLEILTYPEQILLKPAAPLQNITAETQQLIDRMAETMYAAPGVGLAAVQVGVDQSLIIYDVAPKDEKRNLQVLINPRIIHAEGAMLSENEGCLSVPDLRADVRRAAAVIVEGFDREGNPVRLERDDFLAVVLQHEIDHLNGILFLDRISALKRELYKRRVKKRLKTS